MSTPAPVTVRRDTLVLPTYAPAPPNPHPMFFERRVYQGSSGRVYPLPFTDRVAERARPHVWEAVLLENEYLLVVLLPALGGRLHRILDKTNGYDAIYHQPVIKPALVGLAGPWCSGGIEFNWPQHHRPSTALPADVAIEHEAGGAVTVWCGEHEPMARMKGMHGVRLRPGCSVVEVRARVANRTADTQTFLWWANAAVRVHEAYQSFFPPDVTFVADHARRAMSAFPRATGPYYGIDYGRRARAGVPAAEQPPRFRPAPAVPPDDLSWYANIPVPTSYMVVESAGDFCGGYDHRAGAGLVHVADRHLAPGKKQWTWGNHDFGYAWDRNLTDPDLDGVCAPYIELMAGAYTDNQPDFSFLRPGETRTWSQFWYPVRAIGPARQANREAAVSFAEASGTIRLGVAVTARHPGARVELRRGPRLVRAWRALLAPDRPFLATTSVAGRNDAGPWRIRVLTADRRELIADTVAPPPRRPAPAPAAAPPPPPAVASNDELWLTGLHLEQYRHATRAPEDYWREALRRDPGDSRCHAALGRWHLRRGEWETAEGHLRAALGRLTALNGNPPDGEAHYLLGCCLRQQAFAAGSGTARDEEAYALFFKATWNEAWQSAAFYALAEIDCTRGRWERALEHLECSLRRNTEHLRARNLQVIVLRRLGRPADADARLADTLAADPLDWWALHLAGRPLRCDNQVRLDLALDCAHAGLYAEAARILAAAPTAAPALDGLSRGTAPLVHYYRAWCAEHLGDTGTAHRHRAAGAAADPAWCFPARVEEIAILARAAAANPDDARAPFLLGNLFYDRRRHGEALDCWRRAVRLDPTHAGAWRNLGLALFNVRGDAPAARRAYDRACRAAPEDARLWFERDQLWKRLRVPPAARQRALRRRPGLLRTRDDLALEECALLNRTGAPRAALELLRGRRFQPWEGGEGQVLGEYVRACLALGRHALARGDASAALAHFTAALEVPPNLGEARHPLAATADIHYWTGCAHEALADRAAARRHWRLAAGQARDFQSMGVHAFTEQTVFVALSRARLGRRADARRLLLALRAHARVLARTPAAIDYFATSLPSFLLFQDDPDARRQATALFLAAQAEAGLGQRAAAARLLRRVLRLDPGLAVSRDEAGRPELP